jgi:hypothetical protein
LIKNVANFFGVIGQGDVLVWIKKGLIGIFVVVRIDIDDDSTARVESGRFNIFEKIMETNITLQSRDKRRTEDRLKWKYYSSQVVYYRLVT